MGLPVADIAEWTALNRALTELHREQGYEVVPGFCRVSTLKPMAGHMHAASSLGALLKIIRCFQTKKIHKVLDYTKPNEFCDMSNTPCRIVKDTEAWKDTSRPRLAALHSYGSGGNNAHVLLEEVPLPNPIAKKSRIHKPFDLMHCWIRVSHPFLRRRFWGKDKQRFEVDFYGNEFFLKHHKVKGDSIFPGMGYLEMAHAAAIAFNKKTVELRRITWKAPLFVKDPLVASIELYSKNGSCDYRIHSKSHPEKDWTEHTQGEIVVSDTPSIFPKNCDIKAYLNSFKKINSSKKEFYSRLDHLGFSYGKSFACVQDIYKSDDAVVSRIQLPDEYHHTLNQFILHPAVLDSALHAGVILSLREGEPDLKETSIPFFLKTICVYAALESECYACVRKSRASNEKTKKIDVDLYNNDGRHLVALRELSSRVAAPAELKPSFPKKSRIGQQYVGHVEYTVSEFSPDSSASEEVKHDIQTSPALFTLGIGFADHFSHCFDTCHDPPSNISDLARFLTIINDIVIEQGILQGDKSFTIVSFSTVSKQISSAISAYVKTLQLEIKKSDFHYIRMEDLPKDTVISKRIRRDCVDSERQGVEVLYNSAGERCTQETQVLTQTDEKEALVVKTGTYWMIGGGAIAEQLAEWLFSKNKETEIIISSRSGTPKTEIGRKLEHQISWNKLDVCDPFLFGASIDALKEKKIQGLFYTVGREPAPVLSTEKTLDQIHNTLKSKCIGAEFLLNHVNRLNLHTVVFFSSQAVKGQALAGDYAVANAYLNGLVEEWHNKVDFTLVGIDWPQWEFGEMRLSDQIREVMRVSRGWLPLPSISGFEALFRTLQMGIHRVGIQYCWKDFKQKRAKKASIPQIDAVRCNEEITESVEKILRKAISTILQIDAVDVSFDEEISDLGFNSLNIVALSEQLEEEHDIKISPIVFFEQSKLEDLSAYIVENFSDQLGQQNRVELLDDKDVSVNQEYEKKKIKTEKTDDIAIIGMSALFPGAKNINAFWDNLVNGVDCIGEIPKDRWDWQSLGEGLFMPMTHLIRRFSIFRGEKRRLLILRYVKFWKKPGMR